MATPYDISLARGFRVQQAIRDSQEATAAQKAERKAKNATNLATFNDQYTTMAGSTMDGFTDITIRCLSAGGSVLINSFNLASGSIDAENNIQAENQKDPLRWSDIAFFAYCQGATNRPWKGDPTTIVEIKQTSISNKETLATIKEAYAKLGKVKGKINWTAGSGDPFVALLGTPNASGAGYMCADHFDEMGGKKVGTIITEYDPDWEAGTSMLIKLVAMK